MFSHILVGTNDVLAAKKFYDAVMETLGITIGELNEEKQRVYYRSPNGSLIVTKPIDGNPASVGNGGTIGFKCASAEQAKAFHDAAIVAGGTSIEDPPGWRVNGKKKMFLAYVRDLDGNKLNAIFHG
ncbi:MAG: glyoxalase [Rhodospirillaceae bacterium]|nr:glyoxalase [Rhodospirillaceae bacterium]|tara:strand:+ start:75 stop:455 length:381 start_codon:yes stop_codon:yes gene_type:complete